MKNKKYTTIKIGGYEVRGFLCKVYDLDMTRCPKIFLERNYSPFDNVLVEGWEDGVLNLQFRDVQMTVGEYTLHPIDEYKTTKEYYHKQRYFQLYNNNPFLLLSKEEQATSLHDWNLTIDYIYSTNDEFVTMDSALIKDKEDFLAKLMAKSGYNGLLDFQCLFIEDDKEVMLDSTITMDSFNNDKDLYHPINNSILDKRKALFRFKILKENL